MVPKVKLRGAYGYDVDAASQEAGVDLGGPSPTVQSQKDEADINTIVRRFGITGELPLNLRVPLNIDHCEDLEYRECLEVVNAARASFDSLPADVRSRFANDPAALVDFAQDDANRDQLKLWGLLRDDPPSAPAAAPTAS